MAWDDPNYEVEECCDKMKRESTRLRERFLLRDGIIQIKFLAMYMPINYCPFCGQKINITSRAIYT